MSRLETVSIERLRSKGRPPEYIEECARCATEVTETTMTFDRSKECYWEIRTKYQPQTKMAAVPLAPPRSRETLMAEIDNALALAKEIALPHCESCPNLLGKTSNEWNVLCAEQPKRCSCKRGEVSLINGSCPLRKWDMREARTARSE